MNGANEIRTHDLLHAMQALSQLSYGPCLGGVLYQKTSGLTRGKRTKINIFEHRVHLYRKSGQFGSLFDFRQRHNIALQRISGIALAQIKEQHTPVTVFRG